MSGPGKQVKQKHLTVREKEISQIEEEIEELEINADKGLYNKIQTVLEKIACTRVGQIFYEQCDRVLKVVEDTAKWGLPQDDNDAKLERPLPWVLFLTLIIWLRISYFWLNIGAAIVGTTRVTAHSTVYAVQVKRRSLRAIRVQGLKAMSGSQSAFVATSGGLIQSPSLMGTVRQLLGNAVCRPGQIRETTTMRARVSTEKSSKPGSTKRPRDDDSFDADLTADQMLDTFCNDDSEDDSDYVPNNDEYDEGSCSVSSMSSDEETEEERIEKKTDFNGLKEAESSEQTVIEVKENGGPKNHRPYDSNLVSLTDGDSGNEKEKSPHVADYSEHFDNHHAEMYNREVAPPHEQLTTSSPLQHQPINQQEQNKLTFSLDEEAQRKSTPGHQSAAFSKPNLGASPAEGSPTDLHSIFHPAPLIKVHSTAAHSTLKDNNDEDSTNAPAAESPELQEPFQQRKPVLPNPNKQHQYQHHFHNKYRNKNRR